MIISNFYIASIAVLITRNVTIVNYNMRFVLMNPTGYKDGSDDQNPARSDLSDEIFILYLAHEI